MKYFHRTQLAPDDVLARATSYFGARLTPVEELPRRLRFGGRLNGRDKVNHSRRRQRAAANKLEEVATGHRVGGFINGSIIVEVTHERPLTTGDDPQ